MKTIFFLKSVKFITGAVFSFDLFKSRSLSKHERKHNKIDKKNRETRETILKLMSNKT